jgi:hypothetical protein
MKRKKRKGEGGEREKERKKTKEGRRDISGLELILQN